MIAFPFPREVQKSKRFLKLLLRLLEKRNATCRFKPQLEGLEERVTPSGLSHPPPTALTPAQIRSAYGIDEIYFGTNGVLGNGAGQTIAIIDTDDDPGLVSSNDPNFQNSDLHRFDVQFGLPDPASFVKMAYPDEPTNALPMNTVLSGETSLDVEWAHAVAPGASILLVETASSDLATLLNAAKFAAEQPDVSVVSMSIQDSEMAKGSAEIAVFNTLLQTPSNVAFVASTGDNGAPAGYPAFSPDALAVGGTTLTVQGDAYQSETAWSNPTTPNLPKIVDNSSSSGFAKTGTWTPSIADGYEGNFLTAAAGSNSTATWTFTNLPAKAIMGISVTWVVGTNDATNATYTIQNGGPLSSFTVDQQQAPVDNTGTAIDLKTAFQKTVEYAQSSASGTITVSLDASGANGTVCADAVAVSLDDDGGGSGGGISLFETQPAYQRGVVTQSSTQRTIPDVSFDAGKYVAVVDSYKNGQATPWESTGGTSFAAPAWAGLIAIADQGLALRGKPPLNSSTTEGATLQTDLYDHLPATDFHDITSGYNGYSAGPGYDLVTGLGTPVANLLVPDLAGWPAELVYTAPDNTPNHNIVVKQGGADIDVFDNGMLVTAHAAGTTSQIDIRGGDAAGTISLTVDYSGGAFTIPVYFDGGSGGGSHTLIGPNQTDTWNITGANAGNIAGVVASFTHVQNLTGGTGEDIFTFDNGGNLSGQIDGGSGTNWLVYATLTTSVQVNLTAGIASHVAGGVQNLEDIIGSAVGGDSMEGAAMGSILVGHGSRNSLIGGAGRNLLIGGYGTNLLEAGKSDDLIVAGETTFNDNIAALDQILAEWQSADSYAVRISDLKNGGGLNGASRLILNATVFCTTSPAGPHFGNGGGFGQSTLLGNAADDWFFTNDAVAILNRRSNEQLD
jgi:hypothetical protein